MFINKRKLLKFTEISRVKVVVKSKVSLLSLQFAIKAYGITGNERLLFNIQFASP